MNVVSRAVLPNRLAAENHTLKRNMGVYIAEAQRAKRTLQHSRAAQAEHVAHDQHDVSSKCPQPPQLSQQHAQQESATHVQLHQSSASWNTPKQSCSMEQQAQDCQSPNHQSLPEMSSPTDQQYDSAEEACSPGDELKLVSLHEGEFGHQGSSLICPAELPAKSTGATAMDDAKRSDLIVTPALAAAEASFALPSLHGSFHKPSDLQFSQPQCSFGGSAARHSPAQRDNAQTDDAQTDEQPRSHVRQSLHHWFESHQEEEDCDRALQQSGSCETAEHGTRCDHDATVSELRYRKDASPVAAKFAFARYASTEVD